MCLLGSAPQGSWVRVPAKSSPCAQGLCLGCALCLELLRRQGPLNPQVFAQRLLQKAYPDHPEKVYPMPTPCPGSSCPPSPSPRAFSFPWAFPPDASGTHSACCPAPSLECQLPEERSVIFVHRGLPRAWDSAWHTQPCGEHILNKGSCQQHQWHPTLNDSELISGTWGNGALAAVSLGSRH